MQKTVITELENEIILSAMKFVKMEGGFLLETSYDFNKNQDTALSWDDLYSKNSFISESLHKDWIEKNNFPVSLSPLSENIKIRFLSEEKFESFFKHPDKAWSIFYTVTRPGLSLDGKNAILLVTAHCPSGPPNYASILFLEKTIHFWNVKSTHGIYNG